MFDSNNQNPNETIDQIREELREVPPEDLKDVDLYAKLLRIRKTPWQRALLTLVVNLLVLIDSLLKPTK